MTRVELFEFIRKSHLKDGKSIRNIAKECKVHRRTVRQALDSPLPPHRCQSDKQNVKLTTQIKTVIDEIILSDRDAPKKQRHTSERIYRRLVQEHEYQGALPTIRRLVGKRRRELGVASQAFVPQVYQPGQEAEVDWYEATVIFPRGKEKVQFFQMRSCYGAKEYHRAYPRQTQQAFLDAHTHAFKFYGGVFHTIRYDNLTSAVKKVLKGRRRIETDRFVALRSHYLFDSVFCKPGIEGAHEKGGVEGGVGRFRRNHLVPVPSFQDYDDLNEYLLSCCHKDVKRTRQGYQNSVEADWAQEQPQLQALPEISFECFELVTPRVSKKGFISVKTNQYSVPVTLVGCRVESRLFPNHIECWHAGKRIATHARSYGKHQVYATLDHYLVLLRLKPGAFSGSLPLAHAKSNGHWPKTYDRLLIAFVNRYGKSTGTQALIDCLLLHRTYSAKEVEKAAACALNTGGVSVEIIELLVREHRGEKVIIDPIAHHPKLKGYDRPMSDMKNYDQLLKQIIH